VPSRRPPGEGSPRAALLIPAGEWLATVTRRLSTTSTSLEALSHLLGDDFRHRLPEFSQEGLISLQHRRVFQGASGDQRLILLHSPRASIRLLGLKTLVAPILGIHEVL
jgi:hypothetical protein